MTVSELPRDEQPDLEAAFSISVCDAGRCDDPRAALVLTSDFGWLPMCRRHAIAELQAAK